MQTAGRQRMDKYNKTEWIYVRLLDCIDGGKWLITTIESVFVLLLLLPVLVGSSGVADKDYVSLFIRVPDAVVVTWAVVACIDN